MSHRVAENLKRLLAAVGLSIAEAAAATGLDERTIRGILRGTNRPHTRTLRRLADGLGVKVDELFVDPAQLLYRCFDRQTNPMVEQVVETHPKLFEGWTEAEFDELHSRVGTGGPLTAEGALAAVEQMNLKRHLHEKLDLLLETSQANTVRRILEVMYEEVALEED